MVKYIGYVKEAGMKRWFKVGKRGQETMTAARNQARDACLPGDKWKIKKMR